MAISFYFWGTILKNIEEGNENAKELFILFVDFYKYFTI